MQLMKLVVVIFAPTLVTMLSSPASIAATCESLTSLSLPNTTVTMAQTVAAGALTLPTPLPAAGHRGGLTFVPAKELRSSAESLLLSSHRRTPRSNLKFGCLLPIGTASLPA